MRPLRSFDPAVDDGMASLRVNPARWTTVNSFAVRICRVTASKSGPLVEGGRRCGDGLDASQAIEINTIPTARSARSRRFILSTSLRCEQPASSRYRAERESDRHPTLSGASQTNEQTTKPLRRSQGRCRFAGAHSLDHVCSSHQNTEKKNAEQN